MYEEGKIMSEFEKIGISAQLAAGLVKIKIEVPTGIQAKVIPLSLAGRDIIGQSATGTGKTLAYLLPLFQKIDVSKREMQAMILAPTHELAIQIQRQIETLSLNTGVAVTSAPIIGNVNISRQIDKLKEKPHVIVGSSGRILELIQKKKITSQTIKTIIIDEADRLLDDKNVDSVKAVLKTTLKERQILMFSATITPNTLRIAKEIMRDPEVITIAEDSNGRPDISHMYFVAEQRDKIEVIRKMVRLVDAKRALVFINKSDDIEETTEKLVYHGLKAASIHGSSVKGDRKKSLEDFRKGKVQLLVASDVAARGLDIVGIDYVFNLDLPEDPQVYLHRVGRTGRAGESGIAISIITKQEVSLIRKYEKILKINIAAKQMEHGKIVDKNKVHRK